MDLMHQELWQPQQDHPGSLQQKEGRNSAVNSSFSTVNGGTEGTAANFWNTPSLTVLYAAAALKLHG